MSVAGICVVIPYYQRSAGILARALRSVAAQRGQTLPLHVVVVDDSSPAPAQPEISGIDWAPGQTIEIIKQANGGPGAARNAGLNAAGANTQYLAFLDSDDDWQPDHLARAVHALRAGHDVFFGNHLQLDQSIGAFERGGRLRLAEHAEIAGNDGLHAYTGDMFDQTLRGNLIGTSTVVYDFQRFRDLRFRVEFTNAGEDYLFWLELAQRGARFAFSSQIEANYGRGVNIYAASGWGTDQFALRVHNEMKYRKTVRRLFPLGEEQHRSIEASLSVLRRSFAEDILNRLSHGRRLDRRLLRAHWALDRRSFLQLPAVLGRKLLGRS